MCDNLNVTPELNIPILFHIVTFYDYGTKLTRY